MKVLYVQRTAPSNRTIFPQSEGFEQFSVRSLHRLPLVTHDNGTFSADKLRIVTHDDGMLALHLLVVRLDDSGLDVRLLLAQLVDGRCGMLALHLLDSGLDKKRFMQSVANALRGH